MRALGRARDRQEVIKRAMDSALDHEELLAEQEGKPCRLQELGYIPPYGTCCTAGCCQIKDVWMYRGWRSDMSRT